VFIERLAIDDVFQTHFLEVLVHRRTIHPDAAIQAAAERRSHPPALPASLVKSLFDVRRLTLATKQSVS
jgi:hypothetical protein